MDKEKCDNCKFKGDYFNSEYFGSLVECRRYPKTVPQHQMQTDMFPMMYLDDWCGEYKRG